MTNFTNIIENFVNKMGYLSNKNVEGIIFYGSCQTGFSNEFSDIDLHIIFNDSLSEQVRGSMLIDNYRIEYFEKSTSDMYKKALTEFNNQSNALVSMVVNGCIIFDRNGKIKELQKYIEQLYSSQMPRMDLEKAKEQLAIISNFFDDLNTLVKNNDIYANHVYHLTLERIKDFYFSFYGLPGVSRTKALKVMLNEEYRSAIKKANPPQEFIELYLQALDEKQTIKEKMNILYKLLEYSTKEIEFDRNNHRILIKEKNK